MHLVIRVFVIDGQDLIRLGLCSTLANLPNIEVVGQTGSEEEALRLCGQLKPDVILLGLKVSDTDDMAIILELFSAFPDTKILAVTSSLDSSLIPQLFELGVTGFFNKISSDEELLRAIQLVHAGRTYVCPCIAKKAHNKTDDMLANPFDLLSERELQVVLLLSYGIHQEDICIKLGISVSTLKTYRARFSEKLQVRNDVELTVLASRHGLLVEA